MLKTETAQALVSVLMQVYSSAYNNFTPEMIGNMVPTWGMFFDEEEREDVLEALRNFIAKDEKGFPPTPGQLRGMMHKKNHTRMSTEEAWQLVKRAMHDVGLGSTEQFNKLPPVVQKCVGSAYNLAEWANGNSTDVDRYFYPRFCKQYVEFSEQQEEYDRLPKSLQDPNDCRRIDYRQEHEKLEDRHDYSKELSKMLSFTKF